MFNALMYFSNIVFVLNFFRITPFVNTVLYLANLGSLLGVVVVLLLNPSGIYVNFKKWVPLSNGVFNAILVAMHVFPVYFFRERQTLRETFAPNTIATAGAAFLAYFMVVKHEIPALYGLRAAIFGLMALCLGLLFLGVHVIFFWKKEK